ncbi:sensor histidine kinase [Paenibacillus lemnae]|uniref:histidine kinase n=2 Tax=Paenibacillus lemnae TaxID=1330551 RepID=A0A848MAF2_PAELE|nr:sensor histidine kinase [Paenibacillus lemnae]NMO97181.1 sensor histidine kinase [Paenibacillus lemnae]
MGFFPYVWLVYLCLPVTQLLLIEEGLKLYAGFAMIGCFLVTYRQLYFCENKPPFFYWLLMQMAIIFTLSMAYGTTYLFMGFFTANFIGWYSDNRKFRNAMILFAFVEIVPLLYHLGKVWNLDLLYTFPFLIIMMISPFGIRSMNRQHKLEEQLDQANEQIRNLIKGEERTRIARDLHDTLGHTLSLITLKSQLVEKLVLVNVKQAQEEAREIQNTSRAALRQVRELVSDMRTAKLTEELNEARMILESAGIELTSEGSPKVEGMPDTTHNILGLCLREAVTNVVKHSGASRCHITFGRTEAQWQLSVHDNGDGIVEPEKNGQLREKNGLKGMAERLDLVDGTLEVTDENGTLLRVRVPIVVKNRKGCETG